MLKKSTASQAISRNCIRHTLRQVMGSSCLLPYMCEDIEHMVYKKKCSHEVWCEHKDYSNDCYFCQQDYTGYTTAKKKTHHLPKFVISNLSSWAFKRVACTKTPRSGNVEFKQWK